MTNVVVKPALIFVLLAVEHILTVLLKELHCGIVTTKREVAVALSTTTRSYLLI